MPSDKVRRNWKATLRSPWFWRGFLQTSALVGSYTLLGALVGALIMYRIDHP